MPGEVGGVGAQGCFGREGERAAVELGELEVRAAGEDEVIFSKHVNTKSLAKLTKYCAK